MVRKWRSLDDWMPVVIGCAVGGYVLILIVMTKHEFCDCGKSPTPAPRMAQPAAVAPPGSRSILERGE